MSLILSGTDGLSDIAGSAATPAIRGTDANTGMYFPAADTLALSTNGTERVKIDSAGITKFRGTGSAYDSTPGDGVSDALYLQVDSAGIAHIDSYAGGGSTNLSFGTNSGGGAVVEKMRLNATGAVILAGGSTSANGTGITFPATQSASTDANTLDDYEEGTWTPTVTSGGGSITSYSADGTYIKIGRSVFLTAKITLTNVGTASGNMNIASLPFTSFATNMQMPIFAREVAVTGQTYQFFVANSSASATIQSLSGGSPVWTNNYSYAAMGVYPSAN
jgi:hypothetical protein